MGSHVESFEVDSIIGIHMMVTEDSGTSLSARKQGLDWRETSVRLNQGQLLQQNNEARKALDQFLRGEIKGGETPPPPPSSLCPQPLPSDICYLPWNLPSLRDNFVRLPNEK